MSEENSKFNKSLPPQQLPFSRKGKEWRKQHLDWADSKSFFNYSMVRKSVIHKKINYDLLRGKLHMNDLEMILNPDGIKAGFIPEKIQHYPIMNTKIDLLIGEEIKRVFDYRVIVTNPNSISEIENNKKNYLISQLQELMKNSSSSEEELNQKLEELDNYMTYQWQDFREIRANAFLSHYKTEYNFPKLFNDGFRDGCAVGEEIYHADIIGGEPTLERVNPLKLRVFKSGFSNKIEDADMIIYEDWWAPGKIIDTYYDVLTEKDRKYIENIPSTVGESNTDSMGNIDERMGFINGNMIGDELSVSELNGETFYSDPFGVGEGTNSLLPYDTAGNIRVLKVYWKSRRKIKKVKSYDPETGEEEFTFHDESYVLNTDLGEEEEIYWINEAWEGTKIGSDIYVNMRPRVVQYNRLTNPSRCHFGFVGSIYNMNDDRPFSLVDRMKPFAYMYDVVYDKLLKLMQHNWGKIVMMDLAKVPKGWTVDKWLFFAKSNNLAVVDSFKQGTEGKATGMLAGGLNNNSSGVIDASQGNEIQFNIELLGFIKSELGDIIGISKQREGQISNRETVGGVERATLQSSHVTEWLFTIHDDVKRRALECFLETAKAAFKGRNKKIQYICDDKSIRIMEIDGDEFAENDYGLAVDNSSNTQELAQHLNELTQAAIQNQYQLSTIMKLYGSQSIAEKTRMLENYEKRMQQQQQMQAQQEQQAQQEALQQQAAIEQQKMEFQDMINQRDNETKILIAEINAEASANNNLPDDGIMEMSESERQNFAESIRQFNVKQDLEERKFNFEKEKTAKDQELKLKQINKKPTKTSK